MNNQDWQRFELMDQKLDTVTQQMATVIARIDSLMELRTANGLLTKAHLNQLHTRCDERYEQVTKTLSLLGDHDRQSFGKWNRLSGMGVPVALFIAVISIILSVTL